MIKKNLLNRLQTAQDVDCGQLLTVNGFRRYTVKHESIDIICVL